MTSIESLPLSTKEVATLSNVVLGAAITLLHSVLGDITTFVTTLASTLKAV